MTDKIAPAIIYVDGEEFMKLGPDVSASEQIRFFEQTIKRVGGEVALMVWKPRYQIYLRERLSLTASKV